MSKAKTLDKISGISFLLGFFMSKVQYVPTAVLSPFIAPFFNLAALGLHLIGHSTWFLASHFYPEHAQHYKEWYGFAPFKEQHTYAATIGMIASVISIAALAFPPLLIPAAWLFMLGNVFWSVGEYHKFKSPPKDEEYSESYQNSYLNYAIAMTALGFVSALSATLIILCPPLLLAVSIVSAIATVGLGITAVGYWYDYTFNEHPTTTAPKQNHSYELMAQALGDSCTLDNSCIPEPYHGAELLKAVKGNKTAAEEIELPFLGSYCSAPGNSL